MTTVHRNLVKSQPSSSFKRQRTSEVGLKGDLAETPNDSTSQEIIRVLIVDDDSDTVETMGMLVEMWGYHVEKGM